MEYAVKRKVYSFCTAIKFALNLLVYIYPRTPRAMKCKRIIRISEILKNWS